MSSTDTQRTTAEIIKAVDAALAATDGMDALSALAILSRVIAHLEDKCDCVLLELEGKA